MSSVKTHPIASFEIAYLQFIDEAHELVQDLPAFADDATLVALYRAMARTRCFDIKAINMQRVGQLGGYASCRGQEAVSIGLAHAMRKTDVLAPHYRDQGAQLWRGNTPREIFAIWGGDESAANYENPTVRQDLPTLIPIATQCLHAAGIAYAMKYRQEDRAVVTVCGDGGTSKGDFYEALNLAGDWQLPLVFVVNNNQWAISVPRNQQTGAKTLAQKAIAAGFEGIQVDGNDVVAVRYAVEKALDKARRGDGPTLIEAITYRLCDHTTADDARRYQPSEDVKAAWKREPVARLGYFLEDKGLWSREQEAELQTQLQAEIDQAMNDYLALPKPAPTDMFDYLYAELPDALREQRDIALLKEQL